MGLRNWAILYTSSGTPREGSVTVAETPTCRTVLAGVPDIEAAVRIAPKLVKDGAQLIELCGAFGPLGTARVLEAIGGAVPVGAVAYGPESVAGVHAILTTKR